MNQERLLKILNGLHESEKSAGVTYAHNQYVFKVVTDATKLEIKKAVEQSFDVTVKSVSTLNVKGKTKRTARGLGKRSNWKKAYVSLDAGQEINFADVD